MESDNILLSKIDQNILLLATTFLDSTKSILKPFNP